MDKPVQTDPQLHTIWCIGVDHHRAPVELRERLSISEALIPDALNDLTQIEGVSGAVIVSTCNRLEMYAQGSDCADDMIHQFAETVGFETRSLESNSYIHQGGEAVEHLFRVASSLESMVIGEYQIVHQIKQAHQWGREHGSCRGELDRMFQHALTVAKDVRTNTSIGAHKVSVASIGVDLAKHIHGKLSKARLLVIGAGEMAELATIHLLEAGVKNLTIINRTHEKALEFAADKRFSACDIRTLRWSDMHQALGSHDIVVTSTAATLPVITTEDVRTAHRGKLNSLVFIDLAVPRDVEVGVGNLPDVYRYDLDHLDKMVASNRDLRSDDIEQVEELISSHRDQFAKKIAIAQNPLPAVMNKWFEDLVHDEFERLIRKTSLEDQQQDEVRYALHRLAGKLRHRSLSWLQEAPDDPMREQAIRDLFQIKSN